MSRLPSRIAAVMIGTIAVFVLTVGISVVWMSRALDTQARDHAFEQIRSARANLLGETRLLTLDYAKWDAVLPMIEAQDLPWIYENIGTSATTGKTVQSVVFWGGPFPADIGWTEGDGEEGRSGILDPGLLGIIEAHLAGIPLNSYDGTEFFAWSQGALYAMAAARFERLESRPGAATRDADTARIAMGRRLDEEVIATIGANYLLNGLEVVREPPEGRPCLPLLGGDGQPVAYLAWDMPRPGTAMLHRMAPPLAVVILLALSLAGLGIALVRRNAQHLVLAELQASAAARTDVLTGLPNRAAFNEALAPPAPAMERAVLFLDVNDFKRINDSIGHAAGDQVIIYVAKRLASLTDPGCFLARVAGDEFVFVVTGPDAEERTRLLTRVVAEVLADPFMVLGHQMQITLAMGYAVQVANDATGDTLVRQADLAMYEAKRHKGGPPVAFSAVIEQASREAAVIEQGLRKALTRPGELSIAYQPIVDVDGRLVRAEALARWTSPELGSVPPDRFIAVAEQAGLIVELGHQLFRLICDDLVAHPALEVSINISTLQLMAPDFIPSLVGELQARGIDRGRIEVELTEAVLVDDSRLAAQRLRELQDAGFSTALDDFGTGYSSVGYLEQLGFQTLKIDRSFVSKIRDSAKGVAVVDGMITMAHGLDLRVVCEGVETTEELELLHDLGCDFAQGYHLDRPLPIHALVTRWLGQEEPRRASA